VILVGQAVAPGAHTDSAEPSLRLCRVGGLGAAAESSSVRATAPRPGWPDGSTKATGSTA